MQDIKDQQAKEKPKNSITIEFPEPGKVRSRKVVTRSKARATGKFPSLKANRMMQWESIHELNAFRLLEVNPEVKVFQEQPFVIHYVLDGIPYRHYPDIFVQTQSANEIWEIKPTAEAKRPEVMARTKFLELALPDHGYKYRVVLGEDLGRKIRLDNIKALLDCNRVTITPLVREKIRQIFSNAPTLTIGTLQECLQGEISQKEIYRLIIEGDLFCNMETRFSSTTELHHKANIVHNVNKA